MTRYQTIPRAAERIQAALATLRLEPVDPQFKPAVAIKHRARYYMTPVRTTKREVVWLKASLQGDAHLRRALREEIRVQQLFAAYEKKHRPRFDSPSYLAHHDDHHGFLWLLRRYWEGTFAGDMSEVFGFSPAFFRAVRPQHMADIMADVRDMTHYVNARNKLETHDLGWYMLDFHYYEQEFFGHMLKHDPAPSWTNERVGMLSEFFLSHRKFLQRHATVFTHGDLYPTNIMIRSTARRPVVLFDWELAHLNVPTFDASMVYLHAWRKPQWQQLFKRRVLAEIRPSDVAETSWRISTASLAIRLAGFCYIRLHDAQPQRYPTLSRRQRPMISRLYRYFMSELNWALEGRA